MTPKELSTVYNQSDSVQAAIAQLQELTAQPHRTLVALSGGPGSGKSSLAHYIAEQLSDTNDTIACLSMDGFHLSKAQLKKMPNSAEAFARRGAPWTFDSHGFVERVKSIKQGFQQQDVFWPSFDHTKGDPVENDILVSKNTKIILVEGLYLLHQDDGWQPSAALFDQHWFLDIPLDVAIERLAQRHMQAWGFSHDEAMARINQSDGLNARLVASYKEDADDLIQL